MLSFFRIFTLSECRFLNRAKQEKRDELCLCRGCLRYPAKTEVHLMPGEKVACATVSWVNPGENQPSRGIEPSAHGVVKSHRSRVKTVIV